ncbi:TonB-dependent receptor plug domain-containing protein [Pelagicoccus albus]|uniref:TonB-dependent receptor n=1 Tax=Pelagicoccus albus TaxID=415222 RepID=A0A7X1B8Q9_9BACT|nr:TonB-dependent receptor [Pelagicoccus albus]MBC2607733.1 TonB-dependent receptor [Pelagicoccus albus]
MNQQTEYNFKNSIRFCCAVGFGIAGLASPARSQDSLAEDVHELDAFSVSASRLELPIQQVGSTVDVLDTYELNQGADLFLVDALRELPGLVMRNNGGAGNSFGITTRGLNSNRPKVLLNGIDVSNPSSGQILNLGNLFTSSVSRVEMLRGPQSSIYGADALAGVISIDTLSPDSAPGGRAALSYGSHDTYDYSLGHSGSQGALSWSVDGMIHESEGFSAQSPSYGEAWADDDTYDNTTFTGALGYQLSEKARLFASAVYMDTYAEYDPGDPAWVWGTVSGDYYATTEELFARVGSDFTVQDNWQSTLALGYSDVESSSYSDGYVYDSNGRRYSYEWINQIEASEAWSVVAGLEYKSEENLSDIGNRNDLSAYMENVFRVNENLDVTLGARYDDNSAYGEEGTYRATFSYRIDDLDARVRGSLGTSFQAPSFYQLFSPYYGNVDLKAESGKGWDLGVEKSLLDGNLSFSSTLFGNKVSDKIVWSGVYNNVSEYKSVGVESALRYFFSDTLSFKAAYTYSDAEEDGGLEPLRVPRHVGSIGTNYSALDGDLNLNLDLVAVSSQFSDSTARAAGTRLDGYQVVNFAARYKVSEQYSLWLRVGNLFDSEYEEISGYETDGINANAGVRMAF